MKFCNHCGRLYETKCICRKEKRNYAHNSFYDSPSWRALSRSVRVRDYNMDRLQMYYAKLGRPDDGVSQRLYDYLMDAQGQPRFLGGGLIAHHIVPREDDYSRQYSMDNLITLNTHTHEYVHQLYGRYKDEVQSVLFACLRETLP